MSGRRSRDKGTRAERAIASVLCAAGIAAERVPLSGGRDLRVEVKARADGFNQFYDWPDGRDALIVKADRQEPLVVVRMSLAAEIAKKGTA